MDIVSVEVTNDATNLYFDVDVANNAGFAGDPYARFMIGFDTKAGGNSAANAWSNQITMPGMDFFGGGYTNSGSGTAINFYSSTLGGWPEWLNGGAGSTWIYYWGATIDANGIRFGVALSALGLGVGDTFAFDIYTGWSGDGRAIDAAGLNNGSSTQTGWATLQAYDSGSNVLSYTVSEDTEPPPPPPPPANPAAVPTQPDLSQGWISVRYNQIISELDSNVNRAKAKILFIGDSITQFWNAEGSAVWTANGFGNPDGAMYALNLGEAGDRTEHVLHRIQPAAEGGAGNLDYPDLAPSTIVLLIGINNTWFHTNEQIIGGIKAVVESLAQWEPQATIILVSILPHVEAARNQDKIIPINAAVKAYVESSASPEHVAFLDAYPSFVDGSGAQISSYFTDGIHMSQQGYAFYSTLLLPMLASSLVNYASWADGYGLVGGPAGDDDGDGFDNLYEYALGGIPTSPADIPDAPHFTLVSDGGINWLEYTYAKRSALGNRAYYHLQVNPDLGPGLWVNANATVTGIEPIDADFDAITSRIPVDQGRQFVRLMVEESAPPEYAFMFPEGRPKALIMSYDDGPVSDQTLIGIFNQHGIKGTFNLNSGVFGQQITWLHTGNTPHYYVSAQDVATVYSGHEIASHTVSHPRLTELTEEMVQAEIANDMAAIEALANSSVTSFAYPFGAWNEAVVAIVGASGLSNARTTQDTHQFALPLDRLKWNPTTHDSLALDLLDDFLALGDARMSIFFVWGHSWEYDIDASERPWNTATNFSWATMEDFCSQIGGRSDVWYAGAGEVASYLAALEKVVGSGNGLINQADVPVWFKVGNSVHRLDPGQYGELADSPPAP